MTHPSSPASTPNDSLASGSPIRVSVMTPSPSNAFTKISVPKELVELAREQVKQMPELFATLMDKSAPTSFEHRAVTEVAVSSFVMGFLYSCAPDVDDEKKS